VWMLRSPAGQATLNAASAEASYQAVDYALHDVPNWLTDVFYGPASFTLLKYFGMLLAVTLLLGLAHVIVLMSWRKRDAARARVLRAAWAPGSFLRLLPLVPLAAAAYFVLPSGYAWIWPIAQRFPLLALLLLIPVLPKPPRVALIGIALVLLWLSAAGQQLARTAFEGFDREEVSTFEQALATIPKGQRVMGLIYSRGSQYVKFSPFIHFVAYYQARQGGAVMFSFADFPQSPFRFREDNRPARVPPRWEWLPQRVRPADMRWYDYVLVRGGSDPCRGTCELRFRQGFWSVWKRRT
jgi:hypothetical protein